MNRETCQLKTHISWELVLLLNMLVCGTLRVLLVQSNHRHDSFNSGRDTMKGNNHPHLWNNHHTYNFRINGELTSARGLWVPASLCPRLGLVSASQNEH